MALKGKDLAIDLGTANSRVIVAGSEKSVEEQTVVALDTQTQEIIALGNEAHKMIGKTPEGIMVVYPLEDGVISDFDLAEAFLRYLMTNADPGFHLIRPLVTIAVPTRVTDVERRALEDACVQAGAREVTLVEEPLAAAAGAGLPVNDAGGSLVVSMGAGTIEVAVLSLGGIVSSRSSTTAGLFLDREIVRYIRDHYELMIGPHMAEEIKVKLGSYLADDLYRELEVHGRDLRTGMPRIITVHESEIHEIVTSTTADMVDVIISTLETTPPELAKDILKAGIVLTGGMSLLRGVDLFLEEALQIPVRIAQRPLDAVVRGCAGIAGLNQIRNGSHRNDEQNASAKKE